MLIYPTCYCFKSQSFTLTSVLMTHNLLVISLVFTASISMRYAVEILSRNSTTLTSSCCSPVKPSVSSAKRRLKCLCSNADTARIVFQGLSRDPLQKDVEEHVILGILVELQLLR